MLGKVPNIEAIRPMKDGVIADFVTEQMLKQFIRMVHDTKFFKPSPRIICVPAALRRWNVARSVNRRWVPALLRYS
jgi:actin-like ATPase involved in cell morphogenesis